MIMLDDEPDLQRWGKVHLLTEALASEWGALIFNATAKRELFPERWPSPRELVALGTRLVVTSCTDFGDDMAPLVFYKYNIADWSEAGVPALQRYPQCLYSDKRQVRRRVARVARSNDLDGHPHDCRPPALAPHSAASPSPSRAVAPSRRCDATHAVAAARSCRRRPSRASSRTAPTSGRSSPWTRTSSTPRSCAS